MGKEKEMTKTTSRLVIIGVIGITILVVAVLVSCRILEYYRLSEICGIYKNREGDNVHFATRRLIELKPNGEFNLKIVEYPGYQTYSFKKYSPYIVPDPDLTPVTTFIQGRWKLNEPDIVLLSEKFNLRGRISKEHSSSERFPGHFIAERLSRQSKSKYKSLWESKPDILREEGYDYWCITDDNGRRWEGPEIE